MGLSLNRKKLVWWDLSFKFGTPTARSIVKYLECRPLGVWFQVPGLAQVVHAKLSEKERKTS